MMSLAKALRVLQLRLGITRTGEGKINTFLNSMDETGRLKHTTAYYAAHTGRDGGRRFQPQNLFRGVKISDIDEALKAIAEDDTDRLKSLCKDGTGVEDIIQTLIRSLVVAPPGRVLLVADYSQIEPRGTAWLAGEDKFLQIFHTNDAGLGPDPYCVLAGTVYSRPVTPADAAERQVGKAMVIGCGYGLGEIKFETYCELMTPSINLAAAGVTAHQCIETFRDSFPLIAGEKGGVMPDGRIWRKGGLWKNLNKLAMVALKEMRTQTLGRIRWEVHTVALPTGVHQVNLHFVTPGGGHMIYPNAQILPKIPGYAKDDPTAKPKATICYRSRYSEETPTYGGKLTENVVQRICRDKLMMAEVRMEAAGLNPFLAVHDELVCEVDEREREEGLREMLCVMTTPCGWDDGFPTKAEGWASRRYAKSKPAGALELVALNGKVI